MALNSINTNIAAYSAQGNIGKASSSASASIARLSSGNRITKASDDVAALAIGTSLRTGVTTLKTALLNASQGTSLLQVADGALSQLSEILQRQKAIATQAGSGSLGGTERGFLNQEFQNLTAEIDRISSTTNFNGVKLLNGGLGTASKFASDPALAAAFDPQTATLSAASTADNTVASPIEAFSIVDGSSLDGTAAAGTMDITDSSGTLLASDYSSVNSALVGKFSSFKISNVIYGTGTAGTATLTATINGVEFTGNLKGTDTTVTLSNGGTYIKLGITAADFGDAGVTAGTQSQIGIDFKDTVLQRVSIVTGADYSGTALADVTGGALGLASARLSSTEAVISNFKYAGTAGGTDANILTVDINGKTFTASGVEDDISAGGNIVFTSDDYQTFQIDLTGIDADTVTDLSKKDQQATLINSLNTAFSRAGSGLDFQVGSTAADSLKVSLGSATSTSLFGGQALNVSTASGAAEAVNALDKAIQSVTALRANVGALQSRFNFASANLESSIQNQDAARGTLLDTDVAGESTAYATSQVQLQAGIAVLAQANLLPQNLLKLIG